MKKYIILLISIISVVLTNNISAQIPYFSNTVGKYKLYGYTSLKFRPGKNSQETYTTFQYGIINNISIGVDIYTTNGTNYMGYLIRAGYKFNKWLGVGAQITPSLNLSNNYKFSYLTSALYLNGAITSNERLFWCSNTWWGINKDSANTITNWDFLGYSIPLKNNNSITPMAGIIHSWKFDSDIDLTAGFYYTIKNWNIYLWGNDFLKNNPRIVIGIDFSF